MCRLRHIVICLSFHDTLTNISHVQPPYAWLTMHPGQISHDPHPLFLDIISLLFKVRLFQSPLLHMLELLFFELQPHLALINGITSQCVALISKMHLTG